MTDNCPDPSELRRSFIRDIEHAGLHRDYHPVRHEDGDELEIEVIGVWPRATARATLVLERFIGGGFAGQVYRARIDRMDGAIAGLEVGKRCAVKVQRPPSRFSLRFRNFLYKCAFQGDFAAQVNRAAVLAGALWQKLLRRGACVEFGSEEAVVDVHGVFFDAALRSWAEIGEWVEGRTWLMELDTEVLRRRKLRAHEWTEFRHDIMSAEYLNKRAFMARLVRLFHQMGAPELARQYEWWSLKSQPNALKRLDPGQTSDRDAPDGAWRREGLCAIDFRAGLALLPFLPMSPVDIPLVGRGLRRGAWVQFDRGDISRLRDYVTRHPESFSDLAEAVDDLEVQDAEYRDSLLDLSHHGFRVLTRKHLRSSIREGFVRAWSTLGYLDDAHGARLRRATMPYLLFFCLGLVPWLGRLARKLWGNARWRRHLGSMITSYGYFRTAARTRVQETLVEWHREGRVGDARARFLSSHIGLFWMERLMFGWLPKGLHQVIVSPMLLLRRIWGWAAFAFQLATREEARVAWLLEQVDHARAQGMMNAEEEQRVLASIQDPFIQTYVKCVAVHFCLMPTTHVVAIAAGVWLCVTKADGWAQCAIYFGAAQVFFQTIPISPGSIARGLYVAWRMLRDRNIKDYWLAGLLSFWKYIGYFSFPVQMVARFPGLAVFIGGCWATRAARVVPVFGEKGALLEHLVFDLFFNVPLTYKTRMNRWLEKRRQRKALPAPK